jgi:hypothetical protein
MRHSVKEILNLVRNYGGSLSQAGEAEALGNNFNALRREEDANNYLSKIEQMLIENEKEGDKAKDLVSRYEFGGF